MTDQNEFRKPYEYDDETGVTGLLLLFFCWVLVFETLLGVITLIQGALYLKSSPSMSTAFLVFGIAYLFFMIFVCIALRRIPKYGIQISRVFLWVRVVYLSLACFVIYNTVSKDIRILQRFNSKYLFYLSYLVIPSLYILGFSVCWFEYFRKSKKVKEYQALANRKYENQPDGGIEQ